LKNKFTNYPHVCRSEYHTKIDELFAEILDDKIEERTAKVIEFNDVYDSIFDRVKRYIANAGFSGSGESLSDDASARIQLPTVSLPRFNGDIGEWVYFRDKFTALITLNASFNDTQRQSSNETFTSL
jgi:hypothetical protein